MAAAGLGNPAGYVPIFDGGNPRIIGGMARANISGGVFAYASGADNIVSSGLNSFITGDILFTGDASGNLFNGIVVQSASSGAEVAIATRGSFILTANGTVTAGVKVMCDGNNAVADAGSVAANAGALRTIGRAITGAASGGYCIIDISA